MSTLKKSRKALAAEACVRLAIYLLPSDFRLTVIVPIFNECITLATAVDNLRNTRLPLHASWSTTEAPMAPASWSNRTVANLTSL